MENKQTFPLKEMLKILETRTSQGSIIFFILFFYALEIVNDDIEAIYNKISICLVEEIRGHSVIVWSLTKGNIKLKKDLFYFIHSNNSCKKVPIYEYFLLWTKYIWLCDSTFRVKISHNFVAIRNVFNQMNSSSTE